MSMLNEPLLSTVVIKAYMSGDEDTCIGMIADGFVSPNVRLSDGSHPIFNAKPKLFQYLLSHPLADIDICDSKGEKLIFYLQTCRNNFIVQDGKTVMRGKDEHSFQMLQELLNSKDFDIETIVNALKLAIHNGRYRNVDVILSIKGNKIPLQKAYRLFSLGQNGDNAWPVLMEPFFQIENFIIPEDFHQYTFCLEELMRRQLLVSTERLFRWLDKALPKNVCCLIAKYHLYYILDTRKYPLETRKKNRLKSFSKVALGKEDCDIEGILSVGGIWTPEMEAYLLERRAKEELLKQEYKLRMLMQQHPELSKRLKIGIQIRRIFKGDK
jgi:hypothetical protein